MSMLNSLNRYLTFLVVCCRIGAGSELQAQHEVGYDRFPYYWSQPNMSASHAGNVAVVGITVPFSVQHVHKFGPPGASWAVQTSAPYPYLSQDVSIDRLGNVYLYRGELPPDVDPTLTRFTADGTLAWSKLIPGAFSIETDGLSNVYVAGYTENTGSLQSSFVTKFDSEGFVEWSREIGTESEAKSFSLSTDVLGNAFVLHTGGSAEESYSRLTALSNKGAIRWAQDVADSVPGMIGNRLDSDGFGNLYVIGTASVSTNGGSETIPTIAKFSFTGELQWTHTTPQVANDLSVDSMGNVYILHNNSVTRYDSSGDLLWNEPVNWQNSGGIFHIATGELGTYYLSGHRHFPNPFWGFPDTVLYTYKSGPTGDFTRDGSVSAADYVLWRKTLGRDDLDKCSGPDENCNGFVDNADHRAWVKYFGTMQPTIAYATAMDIGALVPEPSASILLFISLALIATIRVSPLKSS